VGKSLPDSDVQCLRIFRNPAESRRPKPGQNAPEASPAAQAHKRALVELTPSRESLRDKDGRILGRFETDTGVTRDSHGKIAGYGRSQLLKFLPRV